MFQLNNEGFKNLILHFGTSSWGDTRKLPYAFTENGVEMLSSVTCPAENEEKIGEGNMKIEKVGGGAVKSNKNTLLLN